MANPQLLARFRALFLEPSPSAPAAGLLKVAGLDPALPSFSLFDPADVDRGLSLAEEFMALADAQPDDRGLDAIATHAAQRRDEGETALVQYALELFAVHHPAGRRAIAAVIPHLLDVQVSAATAPGYYGHALPAADGLEWYREDPFANEHHAHWHVVYPTGGVPAPGGGARRTKDRQGELFFYMHRQMLARYDAERLALGFAPVEPLAGYRQPLSPGYAPGPLLARFGFGLRPDGTRLAGEADALAQRRDRLFQVASTRHFEQPSPHLASLDLLGATAEATIGSVTGRDSESYYGNWHGLGHNLIAAQSAGGRGVLRDPATSIRDPLFYRWHKHVDDLYAAWLDGEPVQDLSDLPYVRVRKSLARGAAHSPDLYFCFLDALGGESPEAAGVRLLGGEHWNVVPRGAPFTSTLETAMRNLSVLTPSAPGAASEEIQIVQLVHREFAWFLRLENLEARTSVITVRAFLAPWESADGAAPAADSDRSDWIEMDKFVIELAPRERRVVTRLGRQSAVIRKPGQMRPRLLRAAGFEITAAVVDALRRQGVSGEVLLLLAPLIGQAPFGTLEIFRYQLQQHGIPPEEHERVIRAAFAGSGPLAAETPEQEALNYCTCGWPYHLLLPRGTAAGMRFRFFILLSDWSRDRLGPDSCCGSVSFCGALDRYPDRRPMGYPFDRPFPHSISDTAMAHSQIALHDLTIQCVPNPPWI